MKKNTTASGRVLKQISNQRAGGLKTILLALALVALGWLFPRIPEAHPWLLLVPLALFGVGVRKLRSVSSRKHGIALESSRGEALQALLEKAGCTVRRNVPLPGVGDIDLVATPSGSRGLFGHREPVPWIVEIKSFHYWDHGAREKQALRQVHAQMERSGLHRCVIWLPDAHARNILDAGAGVMVVSGDEHDVLRVVNA